MVRGTTSLPNLPDLNPSLPKILNKVGQLVFNYALKEMCPPSTSNEFQIKHPALHGKADPLEFHSLQEIEL